MGLAMVVSPLYASDWPSSIDWDVPRFSQEVGN